MNALFNTAPTGASLAGFGGILYAEDFDDPPELVAPAPVPDAPPAPPPPAITEADVAEACAAAVAAARAEWQADQEQARLRALASLNTVLTEMRDGAERAALAAADGTVVAIMSVLGSLLPHFCREHGPAEVRALLGRLLPTIHSRERICVRLHADLVAPVQCDVAALDGTLSGLIDVVAAPLQPGDVKVSWENGSLTRDTRQMVQAVRDALGELGLHHTIEAPVERSMAHAE